MWGNRLGWKISGVIALAAILLAGLLNSMLAITARTALSLDEKNLAVLSPPVTAPVRSSASSKPGDAAENYREAIALYDQQANACDAYARDPQGEAPEAIRLLLSAARTSGDLFAKSPQELIDYRGLDQHPPLDHLYDLGQTLCRAGLMLEQTGKKDNAREYFHAAYALGYTLVAERLGYEEYQKGLGLVNSAVQGLADCEPVGSASQYLQLENAAREGYNAERVQPIYEVLASVNQDVIASNAGDVFAFATLSHERMFRIEAILKLGRYRFDAARRGDQLGAARYLRKLAKDPDPVIRFAAKAAQDLTLEQYRTIH